MLTDERIAEIRARVEAATPGPWEVDDKYSDQFVVCELDEYVAVSASTDADIGLDGRADAEFIAHARQDVPDLLDERDVLIQRLATMENLASGILAAAIDEGAGEKVSEALTNLALYGVTLG